MDDDEMARIRRIAATAVPAIFGDPALSDESALMILLAFASQGDQSSREALRRILERDEAAH